MPTYDTLGSFWRDFDRLTQADQDAFIEAKSKFAEDADSGDFRASLRVKPMHGWAGIWEMSWEGNDGRATFEYGSERKPGKRHVIWRRIGTHDIFRNP
ncbi:MAG TPA: hypothetical protein VIO57_16760 [Chloroflexota bacterium]|jgi:hypothetical protein